MDIQGSIGRRPVLSLVPLFFGALILSREGKEQKGILRTKVGKLSLRYSCKAVGNPFSVARDRPARGPVSAV